MKRIGLCAGLVMGLLAMGTTWADVLHLTSGDRLSGEIDSISGGKVILKTDFAGTIGVKLETTLHMESEKTFETRTADGAKQRGQFAVTDQAQQFRADGGDLADLDLSTLKSAGENKLGLTDLGSDWSNRFPMSAATYASMRMRRTRSNRFSLLILANCSRHPLSIGGRPARMAVRKSLSSTPRKAVNRTPFRSCTARFNVSMMTPTLFRTTFWRLF